MPVLLQNPRNLQPDVRFIPPDLKVPELSEGPPRPGFRVRLGGNVYHVLYLPEDWQPGSTYPLLVEYPGNAYGEGGRGMPEESNLGYGISGGRGFLWLCLPFVDPHLNQNASNWWGDAQATVDYCLRTVLSVCDEFGGDRSRVLLCGFSRGAIACNYIGLRNDSICRLWRAFICHSHYDGVRRWPHRDSDRDSALQRLRRLERRPQFISHEGSIEETRKYLESTKVAGDFTFHPLPYRNHTDAWILRPVFLRDTLRQWVRGVLA
ncbi:MAG: hypothetical protein WD696_04180 [Bryobacteraceae bacterium]